LYMKEYTLKTPEPAIKTRIDYRKELNEEQFRCVTAGDGPIFILAGAGSGKTRVLIYRTAYLIEKGIPPFSILLCTFTNKAAREMLRRVDTLLGTRVKGIWGGTFHHIGNLILRNYGKIIGFEPNFNILDRKDSKDLLDECIKECGINKKEKRFPKGNVLLEIASLSSNCMNSISNTVMERFPILLDELPDIEKIIKRYGKKKRKENLMDFDDLLVGWLKVLEESPEARERIIHKFKYILVDEYQDTNKIQATLMDKMAEGYRNITVVGDDAQSIYSFRGAEYKNIRDFPKRYPDAQIFKLETNYRSTPNILKLANQVISHSENEFKKKLVAVRKEVETPVLVPLQDPYEQAEFIAQRLLELYNNGIPLREIGILYRAHYHSAELELELTKRNIPYIIRSGLRFFERAHIKDILAFLKIVSNPKDELSWKRVLKLQEGIGVNTADRIYKAISTTSNPLRAVTVDKILDLMSRRARKNFTPFKKIMKWFAQKEKHKPADMIQHVLNDGYRDYLQFTYPNYQEREEDIQELSNFALRHQSIRKFLSEMTLQEAVTGQEIILGRENGENDFVTLSTIHRAKGLEWKVVFIVFLADGYLPISRSYGNPEQYEEERRLFYVAVTRAKSYIYMTYPMTAQRYTGLTFLRPSPFIQEIDDECYETWTVNSEK